MRKILDYLCELVNMIWIDGKITTENESYRKVYDNFDSPSDHKELIISELLDKKHGMPNEELIEILYSNLRHGIEQHRN